MTKCKRTKPFDPAILLTTVDGGKQELKLLKKQRVFSQGDAADAVLYIDQGRVQLTVVSPKGKEAVVAILDRGAFFGTAA